MAAVESTIVATIVPTMVADLGGFSLYSWVFTVYLLTQAVCIPIYGRLADLFGRKTVFFVGVGIFLTGTVLCGLAWSMPAMIAFRALQGCGAGGIQPIAATILGDIYTPAERGRVQGLVSSVFGVSAVVGPSLGAFLVEHFSWRLVFWVNVPIAAASIGMIGAFLHENVHRRQHRIDWAGSLLLLVAVSALMLALVQGGRLLVPGVAVGVIGLAALYLNERACPEPMLPMELWNIRVIAIGSLGNFTAGALMMGIAAFLPAYVQGAMGRSALTGGMVLGAMSITWAVSSVIGGRVMVRTSYRVVALAGSALLVVGCLLLVWMRPEDGPWWAALGSFVVGAGMGCCSTVFIVSAQAAVPWGKRGAATSSLMFLRFVGQSAGVAGCGAVLNATIRALDPSATGTIERLLDPMARAAMPEATLRHLTDLIAASLHNAYWLAAGLAILTLAIVSGLPARLRPD